MSKSRVIWEFKFQYLLAKVASNTTCRLNTLWWACAPEWNFIIESSLFGMQARLNEISLSKAHILKSGLAWMKFHYRKLTFWKAGSPEWNFVIESSHFEKQARPIEISLSKAHILKSGLPRRNEYFTIESSHERFCDHFMITYCVGIKETVLSFLRLKLYEVEEQSYIFLN